MYLFPQSHNIAVIDLFRSWQNSHIHSLTSRVRATIVGEAKGKTLELPLPGKIVNQKQFHIPGAIAEISTIIKMQGCPTTSPFTSPVYPVQKSDEHEE